MYLVYILLSIFFIFYYPAISGEVDILYKKVIESDYKLKSLLYQEKAKEYKIDQEKSKYKPQISFSSYLGWQEYKPYYGGNVEQTLKYYYLSLKQPIFHLEVFKSIDIAKTEKTIATLRKKQEKQYITYLFFNTLYNYLYTKKQIDILNNQLNLYEEKLKFYQTLFENRKTTADVVLRISLQKQEIQQQIVYSEKQLNSFKRSLELLTGVNVEKYLINIEADTNIDISKFPKKYSFWKERLPGNPEIEQALEGIKIAKLEVEKRKTVRYPTVDAEISYRYSSTSAVSVATDDKRAILIINVPIYQGGFESAYILEAKQLLKAADMDYMQTKREKEIQMKDTYTEYIQSIEKIKKLSEKDKTLRELKEKIKKELENNLKTVADLIDVDIKIIENQYYKIQAIQNFADSYVKLMYITGSIDEKNIELLKLFLQKQQ